MRARSLRLAPQLAVSAVAVALVAGLATVVPSPGADARVDRGALPPRPVVTGWLPYWMPTAAQESVIGHTQLVNEASPFVLQTTGATSMTGSTSLLAQMTSTLQGRGVDVIPTFTTTMDADRFAAVLSTAASRRAHARMLVRTAVSAGVDGVDLDYETINFGSSDARRVVYAKFPLLVQRLRTALRKHGMVMAVTVPARRADDDPNWAVYDYAALGAAADRFRIMTYDFSWSGGSPGPMAPKSWVRSVLDYATSRVAGYKISFGLPAYGRDWFVGTVRGRCPTSVRHSLSRTTAQMESFARSKGIRPSWDSAGTSRTFTYRQSYRTSSGTCVAQRVAWYDDARSVRAKLPLVARYQLRGVAIWALGSETGRMWSRLSNWSNRHPILPSSLRVTAPRTVVYGAQGRVRGVVRVAGQRTAGASVTLWRRFDGGRWTRAGTTTSNSNGQVAFGVRPRKHVTYQLRSSRTWGHWGARRSGDPTRVAYAVQLDPDTARVAARTFALRGQVAPAAPGTVVRRQTLVDGTWVTQESTRVDAQGRFSFVLRAQRPVTRTVRVLAVRGPLDRGTSQTLRLRFV